MLNSTRIKAGENEMGVHLGQQMKRKADVNVTGGQWRPQRRLRNRSVGSNQYEHSFRVDACVNLAETQDESLEYWPC